MNKIKQHELGKLTYFPVPVSSFNNTSLPLKMAGMKSFWACVGYFMAGKASRMADAIGARMPADSNVGLGPTNGRELCSVCVPAL